MLKKLLVAAVLLMVAGGALLYFRAQAIFSSDLVREGMETQLSAALEQPVTIGAIGASILPRVTMQLSDVVIGDPARVTVDRLDVGASARALLSRRIEQATLTVSGARIELPLPALPAGAAGATGGAPAITVGSVDQILLRDVAVISGGRTLRGDARLVPHGAGMRIESMTLSLDDTAVDVTGDITDLSGPTGTLSLRASSLSMLALQAFASDFSAGAGLGGGTSNRAPAAPMDVTMEMTAERATYGTLALTNVEGRARFAGDRLAILPMTFDVFGGRYSGGVTMSLDATPAFEIQGTVSDISMADITAYGGQPEAMTGRLSGDLNATGAGTTADEVISSLRGTARMNIAQGTVKGLALVRTLVVASSMRADASNSGGGSEAFSQIGASFALANGLARTNDLTFESNDVSLAGAGQIGIDGTAIDLSGRVQLSEALSQQAGRDLVRYTQEGGRVTVPVHITGSAGALSVTLETADVLKRAITNKAVEEAGDAIRQGLGGLFNR